jgi:hypothetical protein
MQTWKRFLLIGAGLGAGFAVSAAAIIGSWLWYSSIPHAPKPWNRAAIIATFDYPDTERGEGSSTPDQIVFYYTLENKTDFDYRFPPRDQLQFSAKLATENSLSANDDFLTLDKTNMILPAKQRMRIQVHFAYRVEDNFGPSETTEQRHQRRQAIENYLNTKTSNLNGFAAFDLQNRYEIDFPNGWTHPDKK